MYLANDVPQAQHVIRHLATYSSKPTEKSLAVLRHLVGHLCSHMDVCVSLKWGGQATGIFHDYPMVDPMNMFWRCSLTRIGLQTMSAEGL